MKLLKEATWSCLGKNASQPSLTVGSSRNLVWSFKKICPWSDHWDLWEDVWSVRDASVSESISHLCVLSLVVQVDLEKGHFFSFFLPKPFLTFQTLSPSPTATSSHHKPPLFSIETPHREEPFNRSRIFQTCLAVSVENEARSDLCGFPWGNRDSMLVSC